jgi:hypothetical protein
VLSIVDRATVRMLWHKLGGGAGGAGGAAPPNRGAAPPNEVGSATRLETMWRAIVKPKMKPPPTRKRKRVLRSIPSGM